MRRAWGAAQPGGGQREVSVTRTRALRGEALPPLRAGSAAGDCGGDSGHLPAIATGYLREQPSRRWRGAVASESQPGAHGPSQKRVPDPHFRPTVWGARMLAVSGGRWTALSAPTDAPRAPDLHPRQVRRAGNGSPLGPGAPLRIQLSGVSAEEMGRCGGSGSGPRRAHTRTCIPESGAPWGAAGLRMHPPCCRHHTLPALWTQGQGWGVKGRRWSRPGVATWLFLPEASGEAVHPGEPRRWPAAGLRVGAGRLGTCFQLPVRPLCC